MEKRKRPPVNHWDRYLGQPIQIIAGDGVRTCGILLSADKKGIAIIDKCYRIIFISCKHIDAIVEPMMSLPGFCDESSCTCGREDCECGKEAPAHDDEDEEEDECKPKSYSYKDDDYP